MIANTRRILITGGGTFLGDHIAQALLAEGAEVTLLVRPGGEEKIANIQDHVQWWTGDVWDSASLRGRGRGHGMVIHTVGSLVADPAQGLTHHRLNFVSSRNVVTMCVSDGVPHLMLMSAINAPWISSSYIRSKRETEVYLGRVGVNGTIIRAPLVYSRQDRRPLFFRLMSMVRLIPPLSWLGLRQIAPMPVDVLARGVARIALEPNRSKSVYFASDLRKRNTRDELAGRVPLLPMMAEAKADTEPNLPAVSPFESMDEDAPFGWTPPKD